MTIKVKKLHPDAVLPKQPSLVIKSGATFSPCKRYRYRLWRIWDESKPTLNLLMLNPSTADETQNDPTVERQQRRAEMLGYGGLVVTNIFAYRATDPEEMKRQDAPIGPENDRHIIEAASGAGMVLCGWGNNGRHMGRSADVWRLLTGAAVTPHYLKLSSTTGEPWHPLYISYAVQPKEWIRGTNGR